MSAQRATGYGHDFNDDAVCTRCGFDGAEWAHLRRHTYEGRASDEKQPLCSVPGLERNRFPRRDEEQHG